jgi:hypothetical protein
MKSKDISVTVAEVSGKIARTGVEEGATAQRMNPTEANEAVVQAVSTWEGVSVHEHRFGGVEFRVGRRELGHLHATFADLPFSRKVRDELIAARRANPHHVLPDSGWVTVPMRTTAEAADVIELIRQNYRRATSACD